MKKTILTTIVLIFLVMTILYKENDCIKSVFSTNDTQKKELMQNISIDYNEYLRKIWVTEDTNGNHIISFYINSIDNNTISGKISIGGLTAYPDCYVRSFDKRLHVTDLNGKISNDKADCIFDFGNNKYKGEIELNLYDKNNINCEVLFERGNNGNFDFNMANGTYSFKPYNLDDFKSFADEKTTLTDEKTFPVDLNSWGNINITTGYVLAHHPSAFAYITDDENNILYKFEGIVNGIKIKNVLVKDVNNDTLKDIEIILDTSVEFKYIYIQMENGLFYDSKLDPNPKISNLAPLPSMKK